MSKKKQLMFIMPVMKGGGAEKVAALLLNEFNKNGYECELVLTNSDRNEIVDRGLSPEVSLTVLREAFTKSNGFRKLIISLLRLISSLICKIPEALGKKVPACFARFSFSAQYYDELKALEKHFAAKPDAVILSFLQPSIPLALLAAEGLPNRVVVSERADPYRLLKKRYGYNFIKKYYQRADAVVFQTNDAKAAYPEKISKKGTVIFNPINDKLPEPYHGEREKFVTTFCRVSRQKNLPVLVGAFAGFHKDFADYRLKVIGEPQNADDMAAFEETKALAEKLGITQYIDFLPFSTQVHDLIIRDAMYVNSSDYEGMSNAMLEAMAIGMPVVCTDCPIGGANAVINNNENGILTKVGDAEEMCIAMKKIASDKEFSDKLSHNAAKIRYDLSLDNTAKKWMELF